jgi:hypothetical protein
MDDASMPSVRTRSKRGALRVAVAALVSGCGSSDAARSSPDSGALGTSDATGEGAAVAAADGNSTQTPDGATFDGSGGSTAGDASSNAGDASPLSACVPAIPNVPWTSPYAGWSNGIPTDPAFFPIAVWLQGSWHATELAQLGVNIYVGNNAGTDSMAVTDLATIKKLGMYAILGQDSVGLADIKDSTVDTTVIGWWMSPDEPDNAQALTGGGYGPAVSPSTLVTQYNAYKAKDPTRPIFLGLGQGVAYDAWEGRGSNAPAESGYVPASDIIAFDIYPYNNCGGDANEMATCGQFWLNAVGVDRLRQWSNRNQAVWTDFETTVIAANTTTGPTPAQTISEVWLALIHSANGVIYFLDSWNPSFREDAIFANTAMVTAVTDLNAKIKLLAPELNSASIPNLVTVTSSNTSAPIDTMVKANGTSIYVFSAISRAGTATASYVVGGMTGDAAAKVVGENRTVNVTGGKFSDSFAANAVHVYQIDFAAATCH